MNVLLLCKESLKLDANDNGCISTKFMKYKEAEVIHVNWILLEILQTALLCVQYSFGE